jgi:hypothetical protein
MSASERGPLAARCDVGALALDSVGAASRAAARIAGVGGEIAPDPMRVAVAYTSERWLRVDGEQPAGFAPLSGFFRTRDGWVRTHGNYPHHASALRHALSLAPDAGREAVTDALLRTPTADAVAAVSARGGLCVAVDRERPATDERLRAAGPVTTTRLSAASPIAVPASSPEAPLRGIRVLDLTRVIAGPVATRTLALLGADVLRVDSPRLPEIPWQHLDTGHGKRSTLLDLTAAADRARFEVLLSSADVVVLGYRAEALDRLGLSPAALAERRPGLIVLRLTAWGDHARRGFDSLVQAASGIAWLESPDGETPGALPAQALDHSAGYLLAAAALDLLGRRAAEGGSWLAETSLRRIAAELLGMPRTIDRPADMPPDPAGHLQLFDVDGRTFTTAAPAIAYPGGPSAFAPPRPWGRDEPTWA